MTRACAHIIALVLQSLADVRFVPIAAIAYCSFRQCRSLCGAIACERDVLRANGCQLGLRCLQISAECGLRMKARHGAGSHNLAIHDVAVPMDVANVAARSIRHAARKNCIGLLRRDLSSG